MKGKKGLDIKALFANHIEKIGFGLIALLVLGVWAAEFLGGAWSRTNENPNVMLRDIETKKREIDASTWPDDMKEKFALVNFQERAATLLRPIDSSKYELSTTLFEPLNKPKEKAEEPAYQPVEHVVAKPGHVILALVPEEEYFEGEDSMESEEMPEETEEDDDIERRDIASDFDGLEGRVMDELPAMKGAKMKGRGRERAGLPAALAMGKGEMLRGMGGDPEGPGGNGRTTGGQRPKGVFYVSVRGVFNLKPQLEKIQKALHLDTLAAAREHFEILDFELERQQAAAGDDPWTKEWEPLNIRYAKEVLNEVDGFDDEPFDMQVFDPVITMPLPMRMFGLWKDDATHPRIKQFEVSPEEQQKLNAFRSRLMEEYEKMAIQEEKARGPKRGGFSDDVHDMRSMVTSMNRADPRGMQNRLREMGAEFRNTRGFRGGPMTPDRMITEITAEGRLLLFRYFDFDVQPGYAYRYRVKLKLLNPNYDRPIAEVVDRSVIEGEDRWTPLSKPSNAAVMPVSPTYFLKDVEKNPLADQGRMKRTIASINIYEWHKELGTRVFSTLGLNSLGQFLGGKATTTILDVAEPSMDEDEYVFSTEDILVDVTGDRELVPEEHPLLKLGQPRRGMKTVALGLATEAMVVGQGGDLRLLARDGESKEEKTMRLLAERERGPFKDLVKKDEDEESALDLPMLNRPGMEGVGKGGKGKGKGKAAAERLGRRAESTNPLRKGRKGRGGAAGGLPPGAGGGFSPSTSGGGSGKGKGKGKGKARGGRQETPY